MKKLSLSSGLEEKIYDLKIDGNVPVSKIITFFPLNTNEKKEIVKVAGQTPEYFVEFKSIFSDEISDQDWKKSKEQIKKKFNDELIKID